MEIILRSIGVAKNQEKKHFGGWAYVATDLVLNKEYQDALKGLEDYSHLIVIYWMHDVKTCDIRHVPQGKVGEVPEVGIFACRCPQRPNPIGVSTVEIIGIENAVVRVARLEVKENPPPLDNTPYPPKNDAQTNAKVPDWVNKLDY